MTEKSHADKGNPYVLETRLLTKYFGTLAAVDQLSLSVKAGEVFGEMSLFGDEKTRSATIQAESEAILLGLHRDSLNRFVDSNPRDAAKFFMEMVRVSFKRLRDTSELVAEVTRWGLEATGLDVEHK